MMALLSRLMGGSLSTPVLLLGIVVLAHQFWTQREARRVAETTRVCDASWQIALSNKERDTARREATQAQEILEGERKINQELSDELAKVRIANAEIRAASTTRDPACLSPGVLDILRAELAVRT